MNWLINPSGRPHAFRGVDWLVELNNLYTKVSILVIKNILWMLTILRSFMQVVVQIAR